MRHPKRSAGRFVMMLVLILGAPLASRSAPTPISGGISADNAVFIPIRQEGSIVTFLHPDTHELTGSLQGQMVEVGRLTLDLSTGEGFFSADAEFVGTVLGREPGTATMKVHGEVHDFAVTTGGHFVVFNGRDGLAGIHATGTYDYVLGQGGTYQGRVYVDSRRGP